MAVSFEVCPVQIPTRTVFNLEAYLWQLVWKWQCQILYVFASVFTSWCVPSLPKLLWWALTRHLYRWGGATHMLGWLAHTVDCRLHSSHNYKNTETFRFVHQNLAWMPCLQDLEDIYKIPVARLQKQTPYLPCVSVGCTLVTSYAGGSEFPRVVCLPCILSPLYQQAAGKHQCLHSEYPVPV